MIQITFPEPVFRFKKENNIEFVFDNIRKQWMVLNEEEWVRQNFVQYLSQTLNYPPAFIALEKEIMLGERMHFENFGEAQKYHRDINPQGMIWTH